MPQLYDGPVAGFCRRPGSGTRVSHGRGACGLVSRGNMLGNPSRDLSRETGANPVSGIAIITESCIGTKDRACVDACPVQCIYEFDPEKNVLSVSYTHLTLPTKRIV